jgi:hypothetical protein
VRQHADKAARSNKDLGSIGDKCVSTPIKLPVQTKVQGLFDAIIRSDYCRTSLRGNNMLFLVISEPRPERPSSVTGSRQSYWTWIQPLIDAGEVRSVHAKVGRGAVVLFDVPSNEVLHAHLNAWADIIPATFEVHALIDPANARRFLEEQGLASA